MSSPKLTSRKSRSKPAPKRQRPASSRRARAGRGQVAQIIEQEGQLLLERLRLIYGEILEHEFSAPGYAPCCNFISKVCPMKSAGIDSELKQVILENLGEIGRRLKALLKSVNGLVD